MNMSNKGKMCSECGNRPATVKGKCQSCYQRSRLGSDRTYIKVKGTICSKCGESPAVSKGMCHKCYTKDYYGRKLCASKEVKIKNALNTVEFYSDVVNMAVNDETYAAIGAKYGITRQAVENIISRLACIDKLRQSA